MELGSRGRTTIAPTPHSWVAPVSRAMSVPALKSGSKRILDDPLLKLRWQRGGAGDGHDLSC